MNRNNSASKNENPQANDSGAEADRQALDEIMARGEDPKQILNSFDAMLGALRAKHLPPSVLLTDKAAKIEIEPLDETWDIGEAIYFDEAVAAGIPTPAQGADGRRAVLSDLFHGVKLRGKLFAKVSGTSMTGTSIESGDTVLVDPKAQIHDGDLVLANIAGLGQVVKRLRISENGKTSLESENPDFKPIEISEAADLRIHGKVIWRCGPLR